MAGPSGPERIDYLAAQIAAMLIIYQGRQFEKKVDLEDLIGHFLSELPWFKPATRKVKRRK